MMDTRDRFVWSDEFPLLVEGDVIALPVGLSHAQSSLIALAVATDSSAPQPGTRSQTNAKGQKTLHITGYKKVVNGKTVTVPSYDQDRTVGQHAKVPAPTTVQGYKDMFNKIPTDQWGGADVGITYTMKDGRRVWLWGDTLSGKHGLVHSSAIVQDGGSMHVSHNGNQLLPDGGTDPADSSRHLIYWVDGVKAGPRPNTLLVSSMEMSVGTANAWDFHQTHAGQSRQALVKVDAKGNVTFVKWTGTVPSPTTGNPHVEGDTAIVGPHHYTYGRVVHTDIILKDGHHLVTTSQNWDDAYANHMHHGKLRYSDWRPIFSED